MQTASCQGSFLQMMLAGVLCASWLFLPLQCHQCGCRSALELSVAGLQCAGRWQSSGNGSSQQGPELTRPGAMGGRCSPAFWWLAGLTGHSTGR